MYLYKICFIFKSIFKRLSKEDEHLEIVGSYRRGAPTSGDIDVIITGNSPAVYKNFIDELIKQGIIINVLSRGLSKTLVIAKLPGYSVARRVDFLYSPPEEFAFAILYFTGSKAFNTVMRQHALNLGYTFNEHGIYKLVNKKKGPLVQQQFPTEKSIFDFLGLQYIEPTMRRDARDIIPISNVGNNEPTTIELVEEDESEEEEIIVPAKKAKATIELVEEDVASALSPVSQGAHHLVRCHLDNAKREQIFISDVSAAL